MRWKKHSPEQIVAKLEGIRVAVQAGVERADAIAAAGISTATYFRWRAHYGALNADQLQSLKRLELENSRLRRALVYFEHGAA
jgi:putative transposase